MRSGRIVGHIIFWTYVFWFETETIPVSKHNVVWPMASEMALAFSTQARNLSKLCIRTSAEVFGSQALVVRKPRLTSSLCTRARFRCYHGSAHPTIPDYDAIGRMHKGCSASAQLADWCLLWWFYSGGGWGLPGRLNESHWSSTLHWNLLGRSSKGRSASIKQGRSWLVASRCSGFTIDFLS